MSWTGDFRIKYRGESPEKFLKLAKMIIPNSIMRFNFDSCDMNLSGAELACSRNLSWYSADKDMQKLMSYLPEGDSISMEIDGEGDYENVEIGKSNGQVTFKNSNNESERYLSSDIGIPTMLLKATRPTYHDDKETIDICSIDGYIQLIANTFADDEKLMPIVQDFMYFVIDKDKINSNARNVQEKLSPEDCIMLEQLRSNFSSVESTSRFLKQKKDLSIVFKSANKQNIKSLPAWAQKYPKSVISSLGGTALLQKLIDTKGETAAREVVEMLGGAIIDENTAQYTETSDGIKK